VSISRTGNFTTLRATASSARLLLGSLRPAPTKRKRGKREISLIFFLFLFSFLRLGPVHTPTAPLMGRGAAGRESPACPQLGPVILGGLQRELCFSLACWFLVGVPIPA